MKEEERDLVEDDSLYIVLCGLINHFLLLNRPHADSRGQLGAELQ